MDHDSRRLEDISDFWKNTFWRRVWTMDLKIVCSIELKISHNLPICIEKSNKFINNLFVVWPSLAEARHNSQLPMIDVLGRLGWLMRWRVRQQTRIYLCQPTSLQTRSCFFDSLSSWVYFRRLVLSKSRLKKIWQRSVS